MADKDISTTYAHDHDELDNFMVQFKALKRIDYAKAKPFFKSFKFGLQRHILWEEEMLFPIFEVKTGLKDNGPTTVMRHEHELIKQALEALHHKVHANNPNSDEEEAVLIDLLKQHNHKEEAVLYPTIDQMTTLEEKQMLFSQMQLVPPERYMTCGCRHHG